MHVGLLGGSFNPPHVGHLLAAHYVRATRPLDEVWLMPAFVHPFGKALAPFEQRVAMCNLVCADASGWLKTTEVERDVHSDGRTVDTLVALKAQHPGASFSLVVGSDILPDLPAWKEIGRLRTLADFIVLPRAGYPSAEAPGPPLMEVSSTEVRRRFQAGESLAGLVPARVLQYAREQKLY